MWSLEELVERALEVFQEQVHLEHLVRLDGVGRRRSRSLGGQHLIGHELLGHELLVVFRKRLVHRDLIQYVLDREDHDLRDAARGAGHLYGEPLVLVVKYPDLAAAQVTAANGAVVVTGPISDEFDAAHPGRSIMPPPGACQTMVGVREILARLRAGEITVDEAAAELRHTQLVELGGRARMDLGRTARRGLPEVILAAGKPPEAAAGLAVALANRQGQGLVSRLTDAHWEALERAAGSLEIDRYTGSARVRRAGFAVEPGGGRAALITAGTSDLPVADEVRMLLEATGVEARLVFDVGVAGLHRLLEPLADLIAWSPDVIVVAAGMDGVLPGIVAGLVDIPVIGVPVSTGYGMGGEGEGALVTMLQSCATGLTVVNIDNGIGAGAAASLIALRAAAARRSRPAPARQSRPRR